MRSLQKKLALILTGLAVLAVLLATWILTAFDRYHFREYIDQNKRLRNERIAYVLARSYEREGGWTKTAGTEVGEYCAREGMSIRLLDANKQTVWQSSAVSPRFPGDSHGVRHPGPVPKQPISTDWIEIVSNGATVGYAEISYVDPESYTALDYHYWQAMTQGVFSAIIPVILLSLAVSWWLSRLITRPLTDMIALAREMREGRLDVRVQPDRGNDELAQLARSLNHLAEELQKQDKLRKNLTADVAHELRTPLATLKSHLEALIDGVWEPTPEKFQDCHEEVERLIGLVAGLESLSRAESGSLQLNRRREEIAETTRSVLQLMEAPFSQKGVTLRLQAEGSFCAMIDRDKWKQILLNLLENALKYTDAGGEVTVRIGREGQEKETNGQKGERIAGDQILITVADTGRGIPPEHLPYIFERFYRVDPSRARSTGGAGIGLAIVKKLVEAHGGTIEAESEPGKGTSFFIRLPGEWKN